MMNWKSSKRLHSKKCWLNPYDLGRKTGRRYVPLALRSRFFLGFSACALFSACLFAADAAAQTFGIDSATISLTQLDQADGTVGIGFESGTSGNGPHDNTGVTRRDPSDVIYLNEQYYVFYTKTVRLPDGTNPPTVPGAGWTSGYASGEVWYATSPNGTDWVEQGQALGRGSAGAWDSASVFTPNVVKGLDDNVYLYYTGIDEDGGSYNSNDIWNGDSTNDITQIGVAQLTLDGNGAITGATRLNDGNPILSPTYGQTTAGSPKFDSFRVDDASLLIRDFDDDGDLEYGLYYKGRAEQGTPAQTKMGLAVAETPGGTYVRQNNGQAVQPEGHEVLIWAWGTGVMSLASSAGEGLYYAEDGVSFIELLGDIAGSTKAPGAYRPELSDPTYTGGVDWGIAMSKSNPGYLLRYDINIEFDPTLLGDLNGDGLVSEYDLATVLTHWGTATDPGDLTQGDANPNGLVGLDDLHIILRNWDGDEPPSLSELGAFIPEPSSALGLLVGMLMVHRRG